METLIILVILFVFFITEIIEGIICGVYALVTKLKGGVR